MLLLDTNVVSALIDPRARSRAPALVDAAEEIVKSEGLTIAATTVYELRRGLRKLLASGQGRRKAARLEKLLRSAYVLGLDDRAFAGWDVAADLWARAQRAAPAVTFEEGDLLIAATALHHGRTLVTSEERLVSALSRIGHPDLSRLLPFA